jgi:hypothetical protein
VKTARFGAVDRDHHLSTTYPYENNFTIQLDVIVDIPQLFSEENNILIADFTERAVFDAISK